MQLGSFYGFTAPMLLLSYDAELLTITQGFNAALNRVAAMDTKQELICFERVLAQIPVLYQPKSAGTLEKYSTSAMVQNGELVGSYTNEVNAEEIRADIIAALGDQCAVRLLEKLQESNEYNNAFLDRTYFLRNLEALVLSLMKDKTFTLDNINKLTREFVKLFKTDGEQHDNSELQSNIMQHFLCTAQYSLCAYDAYQGEVPAVIVNESKGFYYVYREKSLLHIIGLYLNEYAEFTYDVNTSRFSVNHHEFCVLDQSFHSELVQEFLNISNKCVSLMAPAGYMPDMGVF